MQRRSSKSKIVILLVAAVLLVSAGQAFGSSSTDSFASDSIQDPCAEGSGLIDYMECILQAIGCGWFS